MHESATGRSGFQLTFTLADKGILETFFLLAGGAPFPILRVVLMVTFPGIPQVLIDGVVLHTEVQPDAMSGSSKLVVTGEDLTALMDLIDFSGLPYPGMTPDVRALTILAKYAMFGVVPEVIPVPAPDIPIPLLQTHSQKKTDFKYLEHLAQEVGYVFYLVPGPLPGVSQAYWGPQMRFGIPQTALNVNLDTWTNVESLNFRYEPKNVGAAHRLHPGPHHQGHDSHSHSADHALQPAAWSRHHARHKERNTSPTPPKLNPAIALMRGFARSHRNQPTCDRRRHAGRDALRPASARPQPGRRARRRPAFDGMHYVDKPRTTSSPASTNRVLCSSATRLVADHAGGTVRCRFETDAANPEKGEIRGEAKHFGKYRGTVIDNIDPMNIGRLMVQVPDVSNMIPSTWAMPCFPFAGPAERLLRAARRSAPAFGSNSSRATPTIPSGLAASSAPRPRLPRWRWRRRPAYRPWSSRPWARTRL